MFWSGNYMVARELNILLKVENVTLTQVLEADDILQECKADNKALIQFLTKPKILAELITLITEEPPKNVELTSQYRHASIACEVLTSDLSTLSDRLSMDVVQMNRLCDFINRDPPLNPLLASYFSKTVEMLLERNLKQDWYLYHIVCLRVLDFFKSRRDFLPNLLRHISTSAIADTFKYFIRLDDLFNKIIMEWFEEHQFLECLIQIICGTYTPEPAAPDQPEKGQREPSEKARAHTPNHRLLHDGVENNLEEANEAKEAEGGAVAANDGLPGDAGGAGGEGNSIMGGGVSVEERGAGNGEVGSEGGGGAEAEEQTARVAAVASANAAALLCDLILSDCKGDGLLQPRARTSWALVSRLAGAGASQLLQGMFTAPPRARGPALVHGARVLRALLEREPSLGGECEAERSSVELVVAPHLPLLHQALLEEPSGGGASACASGGGGAGGGSGRVGLARVQVAALLAHLALSIVQEVCSTMITLGTPGVVLELFFRYPHNNFLHAQAHALVKNALENPVYRTQYARHLLVECDLLTRLMDVFEENENNKAGQPRSGHMGHVVSLLQWAGRAAGVETGAGAGAEAGESAGAGAGAGVGAAGAGLLPPDVMARYEALLERTLAPLLLRHQTPLGGYYPSENSYAFTDAPAGADELTGELPTDDGELCGVNDSVDFQSDELDMDNDIEKESQRKGCQSMFSTLMSLRFSDKWEEDEPGEATDRVGLDGDWDEREEVEGAADEQRERAPQPPASPSPWEGAAGGAGGGEGWAHFDAPAAYWPYGSESSSQDEMSQSMRSLTLRGQLQNSSVQLATKLLSAMAAMPALPADLPDPDGPGGPGSPGGPGPGDPQSEPDVRDPFEDLAFFTDRDKTEKANAIKHNDSTDRILEPEGATETPDDDRSRPQTTGADGGGHADGGGNGMGESGHAAVAAKPPLVTSETLPPPPADAALPPPADAALPPPADAALPPPADAALPPLADAALPPPADAALPPPADAALPPPAAER